MLFNEKMRFFSIAGVLLVTSAIMANADMDKCVQEIIVNGENEDLQEAGLDFASAYILWCEPEGECPYVVDEELEALANSLLLDPSNTPDPSDLPELEGSVEMQFADFLSDDSYVKYEKSCGLIETSAIKCLDVTIQIKGKLASEDVEEDLQIDFDAQASTVPMCLPTLCDDEDLTSVAQQAIKTFIATSPEIAVALEEQGIPISVVDLLDFDLLCVLGGFETCVFTADSVPCDGSNGNNTESDIGVGPPASTSSPAFASTVGPVISSLAFISGVWALMQ